ncbi:MAG: hypothetical protein ACTSRA_04430 [Promethearchaeota archaeon]
MSNNKKTNHQEKNEKTAGKSSNVKRIYVRLEKAGSIFYFICGIIISAVATTALVFWNEDDLKEYWYYFLIGGLILYGSSAILIFLAVRKYKIKAFKPIKVVAYFVIGLVLLTCFSSATAWLVKDQLISEIYPIHPREYPIELDGDYTFSTQYGDFNETVEKLYAGLWLDGTAGPPDSYAWGESYIQRGFVNMYLATGNISYLYTLINRTEAVYNNSDRNNDGIPGYGTGKYTEGVYTEYIVWDGVILYSLAKVANIIKNNQTLWQNATLQEKARNYIAISETVIQKWLKTNWQEDENGRGYFLSPPNNDSAIFNRIHTLGLLSFQVFDFTQNQSYLNMNTKIARFFKDHLESFWYYMNQRYKQMYIWGYDWKSRISDTSHACIDVEFAIECYKRNIVFTRDDMTRMANTFFDFIYRGRAYQTARVVWDPDVNQEVNHTNIFADDVNGNCKPGDGRNYYLCLRDPWLRLFEYYEDEVLASYIVFQSLEDLIRSMPFRAPYTSLGVTYMQCLAAIRYWTFVSGEITRQWV